MSYNKNFRSSDEWKFQKFIRNSIRYNIHANQKESRENQLLDWCSVYQGGKKC